MVTVIYSYLVITYLHFAASELWRLFEWTEFFPAQEMKCQEFNCSSGLIEYKSEKYISLCWVLIVIGWEALCCVSISLIHAPWIHIYHWIHKWRFALLNLLPVDPRDNKGCQLFITQQSEPAFYYWTKNKVQRLCQICLLSTNLFRFNIWS